MNLTQDWQEVERTALLGTAQAPAATPLFPNLAAALPADADRQAAELLLAAGTLSLMRKAGQMPIAADTFPLHSAAADEAVPAIGRLGEEVMRTLVEAEDAELLHEYLQLLQMHQRRIPPQWIVPLVNLASTKERKRQVLLQSGARGVWLAAMHPEWSKLVDADADATDVWGTGSTAQRVAYLTTLREKDPAAGRDLLAAVIKQEAAKELAQLLLGLRPGLSANDVPLLEPLLKSKSKEVRGVAVGLLAQIPQYPLADQLFALAKPHLEVKGNFLTGKRLEVTLPEAYDTTWQAMGIEPKHGQFPTDKTAWLGQMFALIPPRRWLDHFGVKSDDLVKLGAKSDFRTVLLTAWSAAAVLHQSWGFAGEIFHSLLREAPDEQLKQGPSIDILMTALPQQELESILMRHLPQISTSQSFVFQLLPRRRQSWSAPFVKEVLGVIMRLAPSGQQQYHVVYQLDMLVKHMALAVAPAQLPLVEASLARLRETAPPAFVKSMERVAQQLRLRLRMLDSIQEPSPQP